MSATTFRSEGDTAASAHLLDAIVRKRTGASTRPGAIGAAVADFVAGRVPDYQMAAWLATVACTGLTHEETVELTGAYLGDGQRLRLGASSPGTVLDKHSTGGVGDTVSLIVVPWVAACGIPVAKMSGRGLGHAGGTLDKLESIDGLRLDLGAAEVRHLLAEVGMVITGQSDDLAPGDRATYDLRDATATVASIPLIAASVISKKVALGADGLLLDVKTGPGGLLADHAASLTLARTMVDLAAAFGLRCRAVLTDMSQPLGRAVGNALEVKQALAVLRGERVPGLSDLCRTLTRIMVQIAEPDLSDAAAEERIGAVLDDGHAHARFLLWAAAQGADRRQLENPDRLPTARHRAIVTADRAGWVVGVDPVAIGTAAVRVGAGRVTKGAVLDHAAGIVLRQRVGDRVAAGDQLAEIHYTDADPAVALDLTTNAYRIEADRPSARPVVHEVL
ncbi:thymidine phosphorylase [Nocardia takedensis]